MEMRKGEEKEGEKHLPGNRSLSLLTCDPVVSKRRICFTNGEIWTPNLSFRHEGEGTE